MQKSDLMDLMNSYDGEANCEPLIAQAPYQKEWLRRWFNIPSQGIAKLQNFLQSSSMQSLNPNDEIEGENLLTLLKILHQREQRIFDTSASYENAPKKSTNRVYDRLYQLLLLDASVQAEIGIPFPHTNAHYAILFDHMAHRVAAGLEKEVQRIFKSGKAGQRAKSNCLNLGLELLFGKEIYFSYENQPNNSEQFTQQTKTIRWNNLWVEINFIFLKGALHEAQVVRGTIQCQNSHAGLRCLRLASENGDYHASLHLAAFYARREDYHRVNKKTKPEQVLKYLKKAEEQGSLLAKEVLLNKSQFGNVVFEQEEDLYRPSSCC